jgi:hypothetical protein
MKNQLFKLLFVNFCVFATTVTYADGDVFPTWKKNYYGNSDDIFHSVTAVSDGFVACGAGNLNYFNPIGYIVKYDNAGNFMWKNNESVCDIFNSVIAISDGIIAVGNTYYVNF